MSLSRISLSLTLTFIVIGLSSAGCVPYLDSMTRGGAARTSKKASPYFNIPAQNPVNGKGVLQIKWAAEYNGAPQYLSFQKQQCDKAPVKDSHTVTVKGGLVCLNSHINTATAPGARPTKFSALLISIGTDTYTLWQQIDKICFKRVGFLTGKSKKLSLYSYRESRGDRELASWVFK